MNLSSDLNCVSFKLGVAPRFYLRGVLSRSIQLMSCIYHCIAQYLTCPMLTFMAMIDIGSSLYILLWEKRNIWMKSRFQIETRGRIFSSAHSVFICVFIYFSGSIDYEQEPLLPSLPQFQYLQGSIWIILPLQREIINLYYSFIIFSYLAHENFSPFYYALLLMC